MQVGATRHIPSALEAPKAVVAVLDRVGVNYRVTLERQQKVDVAEKCWPGLFLSSLCSSPHVPDKSLVSGCPGMCVGRGGKRVVKPGPWSLSFSSRKRYQSRKCVFISRKWAVPKSVAPLGQWAWSGWAGREGGACTGHQVWRF